MSINTVTISGNLTRDPEVRTTASGSTILNFSVAVNDRVKEGSEWVDRPNYVDVAVFGAYAQSLGSRLTKGMKVCVEGKLRWSQWTANDGTKRSKLEVIADQVETMPKPEAPVYTAPTVEAIYEDESLPF